MTGKEGRVAQKSGGAPRGAGVGAYSELRKARDRNLHFILVAVLFSVFVNLLMLAGPLFMLQVYDRVLTSGSEETLVALFLLVGGLYAMMAILDMARARVLVRYGARLQSSLDDTVFRGAFRPSQPASAARDRQQDLEAIQALYGSPAFTAVLDLPFTPLYLALIFVFHPLLGVVALVGGGLLVVLNYVNQWLTRERMARAQEAARNANHFSEAAVLGRDVVQSQGMIESITSRWRTKRIEALGLNVGARDWTGGFAAFTKAFRLFLQSAILAVGAWLVLQAEITAGAMIAASILLGRALAPIEQSLGQWPVIRRAQTAWASLEDYLRSLPQAELRTELPRPAASLAVQGLSVLPPGGGAPVLGQIAFNLSPGQALGVIGRSGSGKTTLARTLLGLVKPAFGEVRLDGATIDQYGDDLGLHIGYLPQDPHLFDGTVAENIARMRVSPRSDAVIAAAKKARVHDLVTSLPQGYDTPISQRDLRLSGGQKQRLALARAIYGDPVLLILDEPNSALDSEGTEALNETVRLFKSLDRAVIVMTHRPMAISECDMLMVLDRGKVSALGPRDEILKTMLKNSDDVRRAIPARTG
jgi:PrtD family type I secretion system ABC transporter